MAKSYHIKNNFYDQDPLDADAGFDFDDTPGYAQTDEDNSDPQSSDEDIVSIGFWDERMLVPGLEVYTIKRDEKSKLPYPRFVPEKVVIVSKHSSGVREGYSYEIYRPYVKPTVTTAKATQTIEYTEEYIRTPMTAEHAKMVCAGLNKQMKRFYTMTQRRSRGQK